MGLIVIFRIGSLGSFNQFNDTEIIIPNSIWLFIMILWEFINFRKILRKKVLFILGKLDVYLI